MIFRSGAITRSGDGSIGVMRCVKKADRVSSTRSACDHSPRKYYGVVVVNGCVELGVGSGSGLA